MRDISTISGADFVGRDASAASLGLANTYTLHLLTSCAKTGGKIDCAPPHVGFKFDPRVDLRLDSTSLVGSFDSDYTNALRSYANVSRFLAGAYILSAAFAAFAPIVALFSGRFPKAGILGAVISLAATLFLLAGNITAMITFKKLDSAFNKAFSDSGLKSLTGSTLTALAWVAFVFSLLTTVVFFIRARGTSSNHRGRRAIRSIDPNGKPGGALVTGAGPIEGAYAEGGALGGVGNDPYVKKPGFFGRIPTWNKHNYVQVEKHPALVRTDVGGREEAVVVESPDDARRRVDDDWNAEDDFAGERTGRGIAMRNLPIGNKKTRDMNTAYEPFSNAI